MTAKFSLFKEMESGASNRCRHCKQRRISEHEGTKCLYLPTDFEPMSEDEYSTFIDGMFDRTIASVIGRDNVERIQKVEDQMLLEKLLDTMETK